MVRRSEAPPPGWYPDPTGRSGLLWWDGLDWTRHRRPAPPVSRQAAPAAQRDDRTESDDRGGPTSSGASRPGVGATWQQRRQSEREVADAVAEARRVARKEVEQAVSQATRQLTSTRDRWQPRIEGYVRRLKRWAKTIAIVVVVLVALSTWASATMQTGLLEWLGERIDAATATTVGGWTGAGLGVQRSDGPRSTRARLQQRR